MLWLVVSIALAAGAQHYGLVPPPGGVALWVLLWAPYELARWRPASIVLSLLLAGAAALYLQPW